MGKRKKREEKEKGEKGKVDGQVATFFASRSANSSKSSPTLPPIQTCPLDAPPKDKKQKTLFLFPF
jgi:hypothetical protein